MSKIIALVSRLRTGMGGVSSYFRCLDGHLTSRVRYVSIGGQKTSRTLVERTRLLGGDLALLRAQLRDPELRVVHLNPSMVWKAFFREAIHLVAARRSGKKVLVFWHGWNEPFAERVRRGFRRMIFDRTYAHADCHIVLAARFRSQLQALGCRGPVVLESTVVADETWGIAERAAPGPGRPVRLLLLSRIEKEKGVYVAIDAAALLRKQGLDVHLTIAGDGSERVPAQQYVAEHHLECIDFVGYVRGEDKKRLLASTDVYLFPSNHGEGMPLSVLEAMAAGLPVLSTRAGGLDDFFEDGKMGFSAEVPTAEGFAAFVEKLLSDPARLVQIGEYNRKFAQRFFKAEVVAGRLLSIYDLLMSESAMDRAPKDWMHMATAASGN